VQTITDYLRANITYTTSLPIPPDGQDPVLWVLFDYKKGFCNYYASAEVLMLRSVGIPARMAVGFAQGQYINGEYIVRQRDAHAWPEVYFPGVGWVEFEPTVIQDALVRPTAPSQASGPPSGAIIPPRKPLGELEGSIPANTESTNNDIATPFAQTVFGRSLAIVAILLAAALIIFLLRRYRVMTKLPVYISSTLVKGGITPPSWIDTWSRWNRSEPVERWFTSINWSLNQFGKPQPIYVTPAERSRILKELLPSAAGDIEALIYEFDSGMFTPRSPDLLRARRASLSIIMHTFRTRLRNYLDALDGGDVYSG
jgi:hypothetical protein